MMTIPPLIFFLFLFFNDPPTTEIYTLSLHDALPIWPIKTVLTRPQSTQHHVKRHAMTITLTVDRKSTRLNSSHQIISYAVFCLKKKKKKNDVTVPNFGHNHQQEKTEDNNLEVSPHAT